MVVERFDSPLEMLIDQGRIQEFQNRGGGGAITGRKNFGGVGIVLLPLHKIYLFVVRVENERNIVNIHVDYAWYVVKVYKNNPLFFKQGGARPVRRSWIRLCWCCLFGLMKMLIQHFDV